ncbi:50S ribosome-binding GTPase [Ceratobasidium sp. AG-Ba]|nr:50S ribosome-binding GTPase [Ceratobasidium sp. AG-Ba]QRW06675.1 50S ribosome-binding GTPase [Ceratobasidium sp. AG-Ba]
MNDPDTSTKQPAISSTTEPHTQSSQQNWARRYHSILLVGRSGSGKTFFVKTAYQKATEPSVSTQHTLDISSYCLKFPHNNFKLIDTPGFDNPRMSDLEAFKKLADYLLDDTRIESGITGIVYLHRANDPTSSRALAQNLGVLCDVFLGTAAIPRLTIMAIQQPGSNKTSILRNISQADVFRDLQRRRAEIIVSSLCQAEVDSVMTSYASQAPLLLRVQNERIRNPRTPIGAQIEQRLGNSTLESMRLHTEEVVRRHAATYAKDARTLKASLDKATSELAVSMNTQKEATRQLAVSQEDSKLLQQQIQDIRNQYDSLRSRFGVQENDAKKGRKFDSTMKQKNINILELSKALEQSKQELAGLSEEKQALTQHLRRIQSMYASLQTQAQLQTDLAQKLDSLELDSKNKEARISELEEDKIHIQRQLTSSQEEVKLLRQQLETSKNDIAALNGRLKTEVANEEKTRLLEESSAQKDSEILGLVTAATLSKEVLSNKEEQDSRIQELRLFEAALQQEELKVTEVSHINKQLEQTLENKHTEISGLHKQLQQAKTDCASLVSKLQLCDTTEQAAVIRELGALNEAISTAVSSISDYLIQKYFPRISNNITALNARRLPELKALLGYVEDGPSLLVLPNGAGNPVLHFFNQAIGSFLCEHIHTNIFLPFHPAIDLAQNSVLFSIYEQLQAKEPQATVARWRANSFRNILTSHDSLVAASCVDSITQDFINGAFGRFITYFFGRGEDVWLENQHFEDLAHLIKVSWAFNYLLKTEVESCDFHPTYYTHGCRFDFGSMTWSTSLLDDSQPNKIAATVGFGLVALRTAGDGDAPKTTTVAKALVVG